MTEEEWLNAHFSDMLEALPGFTSNRKIQLFACACCREVWTFLTPESQQAVELCERYSDGLSSDEDLALARENTSWIVHHLLEARGHSRQLEPGQNVLLAATTLITEHVSTWAAEAAAKTVWDNCLTGFSAVRTAHAVAENTAKAICIQRAWELAKDDLQEHRWHDFWQAFWESFVEDGWDFRNPRRLLIDVIGNPFRPYPVPASWPPLVVDLALQLYDGADVRLVLHDALLDAGHQELAEHFRNEEWHPKGCWAMDVMLGRT